MDDRQKVRAEAEARFSRAPPSAKPGQSPAALLHELQVHQIELEMQNEELRRSRLDLEEAHDRQVDLYDFAPVGYIILDGNGLITSANLTAATLLGVERGSLLRRHFPGFVAGVDGDRWHRAFVALLQSDDRSVHRLTLTRGDGATFDADVVCERRSGHDGNRVRIVLTDVTEIARIERESGETKERLSLVIDSTNDGYTDWDIPSGRVTYSKRFASMLGYDVGELEPTVATWERLVHPEDRQRCWHAAQPHLRGERAQYECEERLQHKDGRWLWTMLRAKVMSRDAGGAPLRLVGTHTDITERKRMEEALLVTREALRVERERLELAAQSGKLGLWDLDLATNTAWRTVQHDRLFGYDELQATWGPEAAARHIIPEDLPTFRRAFEDAFATGRFHYELRINPAGQPMRWIEASGEVVPDESGKPVRMRGVVADITTRKQAEAALRASEARLRSLIENLDAGIVVHAPDTSIVESNARASDLLGLTPDQMRGKVAIDPGWQFVRDDGSAMPSSEYPVNQVVVSGSPVVGQVIGIDRPTGAGRAWVIVNAYPEFDESRALRQVVVTFVDITSRKEAEGALQESEQRFRDVVASADEYVFEMDSQGVVTYISEVVESVLGYRPEEVVGRSCLLFLGPEEQARSAAFLREHVSRGEGFSHFRQEARHRTGRSVWLDVSVVVVKGADGSVRGYRGAALDVSRSQLAEKERAALQAQLAESQKLESIGRLAGGVAHDFNNLLTVILSSGEAAREDVKRGRAPEVEDLDEIMAAGKRAADLTRQLLAFARRQTIVPVILDLNEHVRATQSLVKRVIGEDVRTVERLQADLWTVRCDPGLLGQVMLNLAVNARDAMPSGGTLTVSTQNIAVSSGEAVPDPAMAPGDYVRLRVEDTGTGMTPDVLAHVFEPFFTTKGAGRGTGLGLSTVYGIVKQSGAYTDVRSTPGKGTTFDIFFPRQAGEPAPPVQPATKVEGGNETVLVVEDDLSVRAAAVRALEAGGYRVLVASNADEALDVAGAEPGLVHALLTDVVMPGRGGLEVARLLLEKRPDMQVLYMSGYSHDAIGHDGVLQRGTNFIGKPFTPDELRARVREVLASVPLRPKE